MPLLLSPSRLIPAPSASPIDALLAPLFEVALDSESLLGSRHPAPLSGRPYEIPKFMLLGARGGGKPIRIGLFAGLDAGQSGSANALARLLLQLELQPSIARDYALFAYPLVNVRGFEEETPLHHFEARYAADKADPDVDFFKTELRKWTFDGLIFLRIDSTAPGFHVTVRSDVLAREVVTPALETASNVIALSDTPLRIRPSDRHARLADYAQGRLTAPAEQHPAPFEIELFAPATAPLEAQVRALFLSVHEVLRLYRGVIAHAQDL